MIIRRPDPARPCWSIRVTIIAQLPLAVGRRFRAPRKRPQLIDQSGPFTEQSVSRPAERLHVEPLLALQFHKPHHRTPRRFGNPIGVTIIILLRLDTQGQEAVKAAKEGAKTPNEHPKQNVLSVQAELRRIEESHFLRLFDLSLREGRYRIGQTKSGLSRVDDRAVESLGGIARRTVPPHPDPGRQKGCN